jgi:hypothetical protein
VTWPEKPNTIRYLEALPQVTQRMKKPALGQALAPTQSQARRQH